MYFKYLLSQPSFLNIDDTNKTGPMYNAKKLYSLFSVRAPVGMLRVSTAAAITVFPFVAWLYYYINEELRLNWPSHCKTAI